MKAKKRPIPMDIACFRDIGIAFITASLKPLITKMVIAAPSNTITPIAWGQDKPRLKTI